MDKMSFFLILLVLICYVPMKMCLLKSENLYMMNFSDFSMCFFILVLLIAFLTNSILIFYIFFENCLFYLMFLVLVTGYQPERITANFYLFNYTLISSFPFLIVLIYFSLTEINFWVNYTFFIFSISSFFMLCCWLMIFVKIPIYIFHLWLPKVHVEASTVGSMLLAAVILKLGGYLLFRLLSCSMIFFNTYSWLFSLGLFSFFLASVSSVFQSDLKSLIAYSSILHMSLSLIVSFSSNYSYFLLLILFFSHGLSSNILFLSAGYIFYSGGSRLIFYSKNYHSYSFLFFLILMLTFLFNLGVPLSFNFLFEIMGIFIVFFYFSFSIFFIFLSMMFSLMLFLVVFNGLLMSKKKLMVSFFYNDFFLFNFSSLLFLMISILMYFFFLSF
uniref:NADH-ubiquinone oxidoreductase chain 4 n=1 Tax=Gnathostomula armata TaxID=231613 RepID=A0A0F6Q178_9BILA|nr:NADH dehydrogenase subunit 4 [Gnathostomula armata]AKD00029.1 NADH dehydrogenase subunit 4 [Gnathostomula armata]